MHTILTRLTTAGLVAVVASPVAFGDRFFVDSRVASSGNGDSWSTAFKTVQEALDAAELNDGLDEIWVAEGTYLPAIGTNHVTDPGFAISAEIHIFGGFAGTETDLAERSIEDHPTILEAVIQGGIACGESSAGDCFTDNGTPSCDDFDCCTVVSQIDPDCGMVAWDAGCVVLAIIFCDPLDPAEPQRVGRVVEVVGGGGDRRLNGFTIRGANGPTVDGAGIGIVDGTIAVINCTIVENSGGRGGGVAFLSEAAGSEVVNCRIVANDGDVYGGGVAFLGPGALINCEIAHNRLRVGAGPTSASFGGGVYDIAGDNESTPVIRTIINCTIVENEARNGPGIASVTSQESNLSVTNSIVYFNSTGVGSESSEVSGAPTISFSNVRQWTGGTGNIDSDPLFVDFAGGDYRLTAESPSVDTGDNSAIPPDVYDVDDDGDTTEETPDLDRSRRVQIGVATNCKIIDMGAYERVQACEVGDLNNDCAVDAADLGILLAAWGTSDPVADLNCDGTVNSADLGILLGSWGNVPNFPRLCCETESSSMQESFGSVLTLAEVLEILGFTTTAEFVDWIATQTLEEITFWLGLLGA